MAKNYCTFIPSKGKDLFKELRKNFGYELARSIFLRAISPSFISDYKGTLSLDAEGIPTYESLIANPYMKEFIGNKKIAESLNSDYTPLEDTRDNYSNLLQSAYQFNKTDSHRDDFVATVEHTDDGKIGVVIQPKTPEAVERFKDQYSTQTLNTKLADMFNSLGVTVDNLSQEEERAGRVGVTDFSVARGIANGFVSMIKVANNMEGAENLTEEFSHLLVGIFRNEPLVERSIGVLAANSDVVKEILGDDFEDTYNFYDGDMMMIAEEALGHILQKNLSKGSDKIETPTPSLFRRLYNWIISQFKKYNADDVQDVINRVDSVMSVLAKDILDGSKQISKEDIKTSQRDAQFNALSDRIDRNIEILKEAAKTETKRYKITKKKNNRDKAEALVNSILLYTTEDADTVEGLFNYAKHALDELRNLDMQFRMTSSMTPEQLFRFLRNVRSYTQSYAPFIKMLSNAANEESNEDDNMFLRDFEVDGQVVRVGDMLKELDSLSDNLSRKFMQTAFPAFANFLAPFMGEEIVVPFGKKAGKKMTVESLLKEAEQDITFTDRWLDSMADSADTLLQLFDAAVKKAKDTARLNTLDAIKEILKFREDAESMGITSFEWMFERDNEGNKTGNYISEVNEGKFLKDLAQMEVNLEEKYGKNPTGEEATYKMLERNTWLSAYAVSVYGIPKPNPAVYRNPEYDKLNDRQKKVLNSFLGLKEMFDKKLPKDKVSTNKAIQIRKSGSQRMLENLTSPSALFENIKESVAASLLDREDDDAIYGETRVDKSLTDFAGNEFMNLPVLYTNRLKNPNELSDDVIGSLMAYAYMANRYEQMDKIIDPLEVGRTLVTENRTVRKTRGNNPLVEKFKALDIDVVNKVVNPESYINQKLNDFFEGQVYLKYLKDEGTFNVMGKDVNISKFTSLLLKGSSLAQLGFNWLANIANVATGLGMQNIEAFSGQFFGKGELLKADGIYSSQLIPMMSEIGKRTKTNKLDLFFELFDIKQDYASRVKRSQKKNWLERLFGEEIAFIGQDAGDHWLYSRTAIAMALREKVLLDGKEMNLWDALQVEDYGNSKTVKQLNYKKITDLNGNPFDVAKFSRKVSHLNQVCFGIYNDDDANAANRVSAGRLLQQYRKWMKVQYNRRFQAGQTNLATETWEEGYYRTTARLLTQWARGEVQLISQWDSIPEEERANLKRAITEMVQFFAVWVVANWIDWDDDKNRPWAMKLAEYSAKRLAHELGGLAPSTVMPQELLKTVKTPVPAVSVVQNGFNLLNSAIDPTDWTDEIQSGPYKGMSTFEKNFMKAPIPGVAQYKQIEKFGNDIDNSILYYMRPTN